MLSKLVLLSAVCNCISSQWYTLNNTEYFVYKSVETFNYFRVSAECAKLNATLASIKNHETFEFLQSKLTGNNGFYIGLTRVGLTNQAFAWADGTRLSTTSTFWSRGEPNRLSEYCVIALVDTMTKWHDVTCDRREHFVCQREINTIRTVACPTYAPPTRPATTLPDSTTSASTQPPTTQYTTSSATTTLSQQSIVEPTPTDGSLLTLQSTTAEEYEGNAATMAIYTNTSSTNMSETTYVRNIMLTGDKDDTSDTLQTNNKGSEQVTPLIVSLLLLIILLLVLQVVTLLVLWRSVKEGRNRKMLNRYIGMKECSEAEMAII